LAADCRGGYLAGGMPESMEVPLKEFPPKAGR
jgi:hypothetical protein